MWYTKGEKKQQSLFVIQEMKTVITENQEHNTIFFISTFQSKCYVCCIFKRRNLGLVRILTDKKELEAATNEMQFIKCSCDVLEKDRQKIIRRHL